MVRLDLPQRSKTAEAIFALYERRADELADWRRPHLGASLIGKECSRHLWYGFRWIMRVRHEGRLLRLFDRGNREEAWLADDLRGIGVQLETLDPDTGEQWRVMVIPHFGGSSDGKGLGFPEAPKTWHVWECKTANDKQFNKIVREGVRKAKPEHFAQMQTYMHKLGLTRAMYTVVNKNDDEIHTERVYYDKAFAEGLVQKAATVINAPEPLEKLSKDPTWFVCKFCDHAPICHGEDFDRLERNCRTCASSTPRSDGTWSCDLYQKTLDVEAQKAGCPSHLFVPAILPWAVESVDEGQRRITYRRSDGLSVIDHHNTLTVQP